MVMETRKNNLVVLDDYRAATKPAALSYVDNDLRQPTICRATPPPKRPQPFLADLKESKLLQFLLLIPVCFCLSVLFALFGV